MPQSLMVLATRSMSDLTDRSRVGLPSAPRKYFDTTTLVAVCDHGFGISTSVCWKTISPRSLVIAEVLSSQVTSLYGWTPGVVKRRGTARPRLAGAAGVAEGFIGWAPEVLRVPAAVRARSDSAMRDNPPSCPVSPRRETRTSGQCSANHVPCGVAMSRQDLWSASSGKEGGVRSVSAVGGESSVARRLKRSRTHNPQRIPSSLSQIPHLNIVRRTERSTPTASGCQAETPRRETDRNLTFPSEKSRASAATIHFLHQKKDRWYQHPSSVY